MNNVVIVNAINNVRDEQLSANRVAMHLAIASVDIITYYFVRLCY